MTSSANTMKAATDAAVTFRLESSVKVAPKAARPTTKATTIVMGTHCPAMPARSPLRRRTKTSASAAATTSTAAQPTTSAQVPPSGA